MHSLELVPTPEVLAWFGWHDGCGARTGSRRIAELVPGAEFYGLEAMVAEYRMARETAADLFGDPGAPWTSEEWWPRTWFPLLRLLGHGDVVVDLAEPGCEETPVRVVWHEGDLETRRHVRWPSIGAFVETLIAGFESGAYLVDLDGFVEGADIEGNR